MTRKKKTVGKRHIKNLIRTHGSKKKKKSPSSTSSRSSSKSSKKTRSVPKEQLLALGIGDVEEMSPKQLRKFFQITDPKRESSYQTLNAEQLRMKARAYLAKVSLKDLVKNALKMSKSKTMVDDRFYTVIRQKSKEYRSELENVAGTVENAVTKFDVVLSKKGLPEEQARKYKQCHDDLVNFKKQLKESGIGGKKSGIVGAQRRLGPSLSKKLSKSSSWKKAAMYGVLGLAGALALKKIFWDPDLVQRWISTKIPGVQEWDPQQKVTDMINKLTNNRFGAWDNWMQQVSDPQGVFKDLEGLKDSDEDYQKQLDKALGKWLETSPAKDQLIIPKSGGLNWISSILDKAVSGPIHSVWDTMLRKLQPVIKKMQYFPKEVETAMSAEGWTETQVTRITTALLGSLRPSYYNIIMIGGTSRLISRFRDISANTTLPDEKRKTALVNEAVLRWFSSMPYAVASPLAKSLEKNPNFKSNNSTEDNTHSFFRKVKPELKIPKEYAVLNWLYQSPILGENFSINENPDFKDLKLKQTSFQTTISTDTDNKLRHLMMSFKKASPLPSKANFRILKTKMEKITSDRTTASTTEPEAAKAKADEAATAEAAAADSDSDSDSESDSEEL